MATSSIRRQMKNIVNNYSEAEIKVREATSNDPWGPSSSLMTEIADLTYNVVAFSEIMSMVWKRLNDHGKNWRHVYKALTLLDYLIKTGSERVAQQCRENIFAIQTLKDFQYIDRDGKDQGINVREKSKQLVALLKDEERLKAERAQALKTKERMAQVATGMGSNQITFGRGSSQPNLSTSYSEQEYGKAGGSPASYHGFSSISAALPTQDAAWGLPAVAAYVILAGPDLPLTSSLCWVSLCGWRLAGKEGTPSPAAPEPGACPAVLGALDSWLGGQLPAFPFLEKERRKQEGRQRIKMLFAL